MLNQYYDQLCRLHQRQAPLILYNCWNVSTAALLNESSQQVIATSSYAVAHSLGYDDGEEMPFELLQLLTEKIARMIDKPLTVDVETGYGEDYLAHILALLEAGANGINIEDQLIGHNQLMAIDEQAQKIKSIKQFCLDHQYHIFINARTDVFFMNEIHNKAVCDQALERARAYQEAGANAIFIPGLTDPSLIGYFVSHSPLPVNVMLSADGPNVSELSKLGVSRISCGPLSYFKSLEDFTRRINEFQ